MSHPNIRRRCEHDVWCRQVIRKQDQRILRRLQQAGVTVISLDDEGAHITRIDKESGREVESYVAF